MQRKLTETRNESPKKRLIKEQKKRKCSNIVVELTSDQQLVVVPSLMLPNSDMEVDDEFLPYPDID